MIPSKMLSICSSVISRPSWEYLLKIFLVIGVGVAVIASALMAYVEAGSIVSSTVLATVRVVPGGSEAASGGKDPREATSKLDLKAVYDKVENRFKRNGKESSSSNGKTANSSTTQNSALVVSKSGGGGGGGGLIANGTGVLSNNNNSTLRNRRGGGKKEQQQASNLSNSKLADKSNNQKSSSPSVEDNSLNGGFSKKNKENSPSSVGGGDSGGVPSSSNSSKKKKGGGGGGGGGGGQASSSNNTSSPLSTSSTNAQVSSSTKKKRHRSGGGSGGSLSNVCLVTGSSSGKGLSKAEQEETSSTTTESSNSDDFYISPSDKKILNNHQNHQRKGSRANSPEDSSSCSGTSHSAGGGGGGGGGKGKKDGKKNKQGNDGKLDGDLLGSVDMSTVSGMIQKGGSPSTDDGCPSGKKKNGKRKEQQSNMFSLDGNQIGKTVNDGKTSPVSAAAQARHQMHAHHSVPGMHHPYHHHDMAMWDTPQRPMGDGLSELAAQTEAFVMHRPGTSNNGKKTGSGEHLMGQPSYVDGRLARSSHSPPMVNALQMANYQAQAQQQQMHLGGNVSANLRHRRHAGIIGQRYGPPPPGGMGILSPSSAFYQQQNGSARQHTPPTRVGGGAPGLSGVGGAGSGWGTDILPDNGCDIWSRKSSLDNNGANGGGGGGAMAQTFSSVAGSASSASSTLANDLPPMYSTGNMVPPGYSALFEGFPASSSPGLSNRSSDDGGYYSLGSAGGNNGTGAAGGTMVSSVAGASGSNARNGVARNSADNSQLFGYGMEIFNSLNLPLSSTYDMGGYRSSVSTSTAAVRAPQVSMSGAGPATGAPSHNYLHRMRSEPVAREEPRGFGTTSSKLITWSY